jgi:hypothetical protein
MSMLPPRYIFLGVVLLSCQTAWAAARLSGTIQDQQGAVLPRAQVTLIHEATGLTRNVLASETGEYLFLELPFGQYRLEVQANGFRRHVQAGIALSVDQSARNDVTLRIGDVVQEVIVRGQASIVESNISEVKYTVDSLRIKDIPLAGRNILALSSLMPGVVSGGIPAGGGEGSLLYVNGNRNAHNNFQLDGANFADESYYHWPNRYPPPDSIEEFTILTNAYKAEYGQGAAVINAVTKSGTNQFHGSVWEFVRNNKLNARNFFGGPTTNKYQFNQFGGALGGPVIKDKTFFFVSYEGFRGRLGNSPSTSIVPTAAERSGDFSSRATPLLDPATRTAFPGNRIPASRLNPTAQRILSTFIPAANASDNRFVFAFPAQDSYNQGVFKADHSFTGKSRISVRGVTTPGPTLSAYASFPGFARGRDRTTNNLSIAHTYVVSPTMLNEFRATAQRSVILQDFFQDNPISQRELGFQTNPIPPSSTLPGISIAGYFSAGTSRQYQKYLQGETFIFNDSHSVIHGRHTLKFGGEYRRGRDGNWGGYNTNGAFSFSGELTGNALGDYLLGLPASYSQRSPTGYEVTNYALVGYAQDDFKVTRRLTLNLGFRYEFNANPKDVTGQLAFYTPENFATGVRSKVFPTAPPGMLFVGDEGMPDRGGFNHWGTWGVLGPRFGFAYDLFGRGKTALRGGFAITNVPVDLQMVSNSTQTPPFVMIASLTYPAGFTNPFQGRVDPFPSWKPGVPYDLTPLFPAEFYPNSLDYRNGYSQQWNFTIDQELTPDTKLSVSYVGMRGIGYWNMQPFNTARYVPGTDAGGAPLSTVQNTDARRPWAPFYTGGLLFSTDATRRSNSLQISVQRRYSRGLTVMAHYALSNTMSWCDDGDACGTQNPDNHFADYARANQDVRHRAVASWIYDLPKFTSSRGAGILLNGWEVTGALTLQGGMPLNVTTGTDNSRTGIGADRPNVVGDWRLPDDRPKAEKLAQYFNVRAFAPNPIGTFGNVGRNVLRGPGLVNLDLGLFKDFQINENHSFQLRAEGFNALNRANFGAPVTRLASPTAGSILSAGSARIVQLGLKYIF